ncbi:DUF2252 domain-containing protein [Kitasatospora paracochleata]|uniref:Uncharacterized protein (DUF2252 family) n=1 Tax=Kitasatospora paracochleata TaxID=58354 RepID=A0ABT1J0K8_9ACTN|nr:DUF2252 domain-containing protein [Kitasatospora paracochleata]MCP2310950.1 uncharacterized protein (DUF2252 family) [Kitasatospora paracochleata]
MTSTPSTAGSARKHGSKRAAPARPRPPKATPPAHPAHLTPAERAAKGEAARKAVPLGAHAGFDTGPDRADPVAILEGQADSRVAELVPIRYGRMLVSAFTFYRGAAAVMAADLARTPASGLHAQLCGDAHLSNFGLFASPERRLMFDVNDFDETFPGPWEWDVKRLAASLEIAARENDFTAKQRAKIQRAAVRGYQRAMADFAGMRRIDVWYARADVDDIAELLAGQLKKTARKKLDKTIAKAQARDSLRAFGKLTEVVGDRRRIVADPPLLVPIADLLSEKERAVFQAMILDLLRRYQATLPSDRGVLLEGYQFVDMARKVVGVGSVGTRCWIALLTGRDSDDPLFLQVKEAQPSVLAEFLPHGPTHGNEGERVVRGQRLMQAASDIFLGWESVEGVDGRHRDFYVRQLADWKGSADIGQMVPGGLARYGELCGWTLARAHARSGDSIAIAAYLGDDKEFSHAIAEFSSLYADQNERDFAALEQAERDGRIGVERGL